MGTSKTTSPPRSNYQIQTMAISLESLKSTSRNGMGASCLPHHPFRHVFTPSFIGSIYGKPVRWQNDIQLWPQWNMKVKFLGLGKAWLQYWGCSTVLCRWRNEGGKRRRACPHRPCTGNTKPVLQASHTPPVSSHSANSHPFIAQNTTTASPSLARQTDRENWIHTHAVFRRYMRYPKLHMDFHFYTEINLIFQCYFSMKCPQNCRI